MQQQPRSRPGKTKRIRNQKNKNIITDAEKLTESLLCDSFLQKSEKLSVQSIKEIIIQLGYRPLNIIDAVLDLNSQYPIVAILYPLNSNDINGRYPSIDGRKPFPTTLWITCREVYSKISRLEDLGWVTKLQIRLNNGGEQNELLSKTGNNDYIKQMRNAHERYAEYRWSLLSEDDKELVASKQW